MQWVNNHNNTGSLYVFDNHKVINRNRGCYVYPHGVQVHLHNYIIILVNKYVCTIHTLFLCILNYKTYKFTLHMSDCTVHCTVCMLKYYIFICRHKLLCKLTMYWEIIHLESVTYVMSLIFCGKWPYYNIRKL